ncbi:MAG: sugar phosphate isomerase/epimerase family protein [Pirellulales bacterium]
MKFGMNLLLWSGKLEERLWPTVEMLREMGYDGVELPLFEPEVDLFAQWGQRLDDLGMGRTAVTICGADNNPISSDRAVRARGVESVRRAIDCCQAAGCTHLVGPYHSALGEFSGAGPTADEWKWGVESMRQMAESAADAGVMLAVECLNRFETYLLNTHADAARFVQQVDNPNCRMMYDTFHANIEEKDVHRAIQACGDVLVHVHISENDRSTPGKGGVPWEATFDALREADYDGWLVVEAFGLALPEIAAATKIWRRMFESETELAQDALALMRGHVERRW